MNLKNENFTYTEGRKIAKHLRSVIVYSYTSVRNFYNVHVFPYGTRIYRQNDYAVERNKYHDAIIKHFKLEE